MKENRDFWHSTLKYSHKTWWRHNEKEEKKTRQHRASQTIYTLPVFENESVKHRDKNSKYRCVSDLIVVASAHTNTTSWTNTHTHTRIVMYIVCVCVATYQAYGVKISTYTTIKKYHTMRSGQHNILLLHVFVWLHILFFFIIRRLSASLYIYITSFIHRAARTYSVRVDRKRRILL